MNENNIIIILPFQQKNNKFSIRGSLIFSASTLKNKIFLNDDLGQLSIFLLYAQCKEYIFLTSKIVGRLEGGYLVFLYF